MTMRITVDQATFLRELSLLQGIIERKATLPILSNILLRGEDGGRLLITATDLEIGFRSSVPATVEAPGLVTVHARRLHDIIRRLPPGNVGFRLDGGSLHITCERIHYRLATQDPEHFPALREKEGQPTAQIDAVPLAEMIKKVLFAITADDPRYYIGGALWEFVEGQLTIVGTDGNRMALSRRSVQQTESGDHRLVVPRKAVAELLKLASDHEGDVFIWHEGASLFARMGERELSTSLQEQKFPDYNKVLPTANDKVVIVSTAAIKSAIERVAVLSQEHSHLVRLDLRANQLEVSSSHQQLGEAQEQLEVEYTGEDFSIGFNAQYLLDFLAVCGSEQIEISLGQPMGQSLFRPVRDEEDRREDLYVVMPMALS
ncbi:MAG TPA: DNA polymerase III subunit beta [Acidobacteria bacterium]|nr:DNA polymerase III subunit beta [Acidobacteriota bacterium]